MQTMNRRRALTVSTSTLGVFFLQGCLGGQSPLQVLESLISYASTFLQLLQTIFSVLLPTLPSSSQTAAQAAYTALSETLATAISVAQDAVAAYVAGTGPAPNYTTLTTAIQQAVAAIVSFYEETVGQTTASFLVKFKTQKGEYSVSLADATAEVEKQATTIAHWR